MQSLRHSHNVDSSSPVALTPTKHLFPSTRAASSTCPRTGNTLMKRCTWVVALHRCPRLLQCLLWRKSRILSRWPRLFQRSARWAKTHYTREKPAGWPLEATVGNSKHLLRATETRPVHRSRFRWKRRAKSSNWYAIALPEDLFAPRGCSG